MKKWVWACMMLMGLPAWAQEMNFNVVNFSERATVSIPNDTIEVTLLISEQGNDRQVVSNAVTRRLNLVQVKMKNYGGLESQLMNRQVYPRYNDKGQIVGWVDGVHIHVKSQNFEALGKLMAETQNEARVEHLSFGISPQSQAKAVEEASQKALQAFDARAKQVSKTLGFDGRYKLVNLNLNQSFEQYEMAQSSVAMTRAYSAKAYTPEMDMHYVTPGNRQVHQTVSGSIQLY